MTCGTHDFYEQRPYKADGLTNSHNTILYYCLVLALSDRALLFSALWVKPIA